MPARSWTPLLSRLHAHTQPIGVCQMLPSQCKTCCSCDCFVVLCPLLLAALGQACAGPTCMVLFASSPPPQQLMTLTRSASKQQMSRFFSDVMLGFGPLCVG